jgi:glycogen debranching enzyme
MPEPNSDTAVPAAPVGIPEFYVHASGSLAERRPRMLKHGDSFAVFDHNGDIASGRDSPEGLYHADTRYLSHYDLTIHGMRPMLLSSNLRGDNAALICDLTNPDIEEDGRVLLERDLIHVARTKFLWDGACYERLAIRNFSAEPKRIRLMLRFAADFADLFEVRGSRRPRRGRGEPPVVGKDQVVLGYVGLDEVRRSTSLHFDPEPLAVGPDHALFEADLPPRRGSSIYVKVSFSEAADRRPIREQLIWALRDSRRALRHSSSRAASLDSSNDLFGELARRTTADICMLLTDKPEGPYPYAGIPWYSTAFGRDALITALEMLWMDPAIARGVLGFLAVNQATEEDPHADAEPGKILHETRSGEMAALGEVPFRRYYGSIDSTPLFVLLAGAYLDRTGDIGTIRGLWPNIRAALDWIDRYGDRDGDGFVEYGRRTEQGLANQGWKDSHDSIFHADGTLPHGPIALCEVQAYVFAAKRAAAAIARRLGEAELAGTLDKEAELLRCRFEAAFWDEPLGTYVLALDGDKRPCRVRSSNAGHALFTGIAAPDRAVRVAAQLMSSRFFTGWGIRTVAAGEARYNPMSYHNGSVWPHDNALTAMGFARYGLKKEAARVFDGLLAVASHMDLRRLPELFCGFSRRPGRGPTLYPVACIPQAWAAAAPMAVLQACLGLEFAPDIGTILFDQPVLPAGLDNLALRGLTLGEGQVEVRIGRHDQEVALSVLGRAGGLQVVTRS